MEKYKLECIFVEIVCSVCNVHVASSDKSLQCDKCNEWCHIKVRCSYFSTNKNNNVLCAMFTWPAHINVCSTTSAMSGSTSRYSYYHQPIVSKI